MKKTVPRLMIYTMWLMSAVLLLAGAYAASAQPRAGAGAAQSGDSAVSSRPAQAPQTAVPPGAAGMNAQAVDSQAAPLVEAPPETLDPPFDFGAMERVCSFSPTLSVT